jgi:hypothetical protein
VADAKRALAQLRAAEAELSGSPTDVAEAVTSGAIERVIAAKDEVGRIFVEAIRQLGDA